VLEATDRVGGVIQSAGTGRRILDFGPQRTRVTPPVEALIRLLGLEDRRVEVPADIPLFVYRKGRLRSVPFGPGELARTDLLSLRGKLRLLLEPFTGPFAPDETVASFFVRKFGREAYEGAMGPLFGGLYGSDPGEMYVRHSLAQTLGGYGMGKSIVWGLLRGRFGREGNPAATSFLGGMQEFTDAMGARVAHRVSLGSPVTGLAARPGGGWQVERKGADPIEADTVVLTLPSAEAAALLEPTQPDAARRLQGLRYNTLAVVHLSGPSTLHGLGYQVGYGEPLRTRGVTWNASALDRDGIYTAFLGGARDPEILTWPDDRIGETARTEFQMVTGVETEVLSVHRTWVPSWDRSWEALEGLSLPPGLHLCTNYESRVGIPGRIGRALALANQLGGGAASSRVREFRQ
jgi:protoporphyrinogen/coproporphyrinogen III oxidase